MFFPIVPVDIVTNSLLIITAYHGGKDAPKLTDPAVYHCDSRHPNPLYFDEAMRMTNRNTKYVPVEDRKQSLSKIHVFKNKAEELANNTINESIPLAMVKIASMLPIP